MNNDIDRLYPLYSDIYIGSGRFKEARYALLDKTGKIFKFFGDYPNYQKNEDTIPNFPRFMSHQTQFSFNPSRRLLACVTAHVLDIIDLADLNILKNKKRILVSPYEYTYSYGKDWATAEAINYTETGVVDVSSNSKYIYLLYSFTQLSLRNEKKKIKEILIFDWTGIPVQRIIPDKEVIRICADEENNTIYCIVNKSNPEMGYIKI